VDRARMVAVAPAVVPARAQDRDPAREESQESGSW